MGAPTKEWFFSESGWLVAFFRNVMGCKSTLLERGYLKSGRYKIIHRDNINSGSPTKDSCQSKTALKRQEIQDQSLVNGERGFGIIQRMC
jgi:hypothetical protein